MKTPTLLFLLVAYLCAEPLAPIPVKPPGTSPTIQAELEIRYWRANVEAQRAQAMSQAAVSDLQKLSLEIMSACGESHQPQDKVGTDGKPTGRLICAPKPKPELAK